MTFQCYLPRSREHAAVGAVFVTVGGVRRLIPDHWLAEAELSEQGRLLRLVYTCCTIEVSGERLEPLFEDVVVGRLGTVSQAPVSFETREQPRVSSILAIVPAAAVSALERR